MSARNCLLICGFLVAGASVSAQSGGSPDIQRFRVSGVVVDEGHVPIPDVQLRIQQNADSGRIIRTGTDGLFVFTDVPDGRATILLKRLGYTPVSLPINVTSSAANRNLEIVMKGVPQELANVVVLGQDSRLREFYQRRNAHSSGTYITQADLQKMNARFTSDIFRRVPGASLRSARFGNAIRLRGCRPKVWMDGVPMRDIELDELTTPAQIAGLEVYASTAGIPAEYMDMAPRPCGVILVWTRVD